MKNNPEQPTFREYYYSLFKDYIEKEYKSSRLEKHPTLYSTKTHQTPKSLALKLVDYFTYAAENDKPISIVGAALYVGFTNTSQFTYYQDSVMFKEDFIDVIQIMKSLVEEFNVEKLYNKNTMTGGRFILTCGFQGKYTPVTKQIVENQTVNVEIGKKND